MSDPTIVAPPDGGAPLTVGTIARYLLGDREAILAVAHNRASLPIGGLLVLSAGLAREYDGRDLVHEPWYLLVPLAASLVAATLLFQVIGICTLGRWREGRRPTRIEAYRSFLRVFWMTAPLAWLYAVPYERFMGPAEAVKLNLITLGVVAAWRVALIIRAASVLYEISAAALVCPVLLFANVMALGAVRILPVPIVDFMGGIQYADADAPIARGVTALLMNAPCTIAMLVVGTLISLRSCRPGRDWPSHDASGPARGPWRLAIGAIVIGLSVLPFTQPEQLRRRRADALLRSGAIDEALAYMSARPRDAFPPHWNPAPRIGYGEARPRLDAVIAAIDRNPSCAGWIVEAYADKIERQLRRRIGGKWGSPTWPGIVLDARENPGMLDDALERRDELRWLSGHALHLANEDKAALDRLIEMTEGPRRAGSAGEAEPEG